RHGRASYFPDQIINYYGKYDGTGAAVNPSRGSPPEQSRFRRRDARAVESVLPPREPHHEGVEQGEQHQPDRRVEGHSIALVADERDKEGKHRRVGPSLFSEEGNSEDDLHEAVRQEID